MSFSHAAPAPRSGTDHEPLPDPVADSADVVELEVPADAAYLGVVRTACSGLGARLDLTLDEIEDLRIAVDEACALVLGPAGTGRLPGARLRASFTLGRSVLSISVHGPNTDLPHGGNFAWTVLEALAGDVSSGHDESGAWIRLTHERGRLS